LNDDNLFEKEKVDYTDVEKKCGKKKKIRKRANFHRTGFELTRLVKFFVHCERISFNLQERKRFKISFIAYGTSEKRSIPFQFYDVEKAQKFLSTFKMIKKLKQTKQY